MSDEPYDTDSDYSWTELAFQALQRGELKGELIDAKGIVSSRVHGPCPRCGHRIDDAQTHTAVTDLVRPTRTPEPGEEPAYGVVDVTCVCDVTHPQAPESVKGCGVSFRVELLIARKAGV